MANIVLTPRPAVIGLKGGSIDTWLRHYDDLQWEEDLKKQQRKWPSLPIIAGGAAAGAWTLTNELRIILMGATGAIVPATDTVKIGLAASTSNLSATSTTYAGVTNELSTANGYTVGGITTTLTVSTVSTSQGQLAFTQAQWTASGGSITARFGFAYKSAGHLYGYFLCDSTPADVTATTGNTFTISSGNLWVIA